MVTGRYGVPLLGLAKSIYYFETPFLMIFKYYAWASYGSVSFGQQPTKNSYLVTLRAMLHEVLIEVYPQKLKFTCTGGVFAVGSNRVKLKLKYEV